MAKKSTFIVSLCCVKELGSGVGGRGREGMVFLGGGGGGGVSEQRSCAVKMVVSGLSRDPVLSRWWFQV